MDSDISVNPKNYRSPPNEILNLQNLVRRHSHSVCPRNRVSSISRRLFQVLDKLWIGNRWVSLGQFWISFFSKSSGLL